MLEARLIAWAAATLRQPCALKFAAIETAQDFAAFTAPGGKAAAPDKGRACGRFIARRLS
jgi:hypothetical protein